MSKNGYQLVCRDKHTCALAQFLHQLHKRAFPQLGHCLGSHNNGIWNQCMFLLDQWQKRRCYCKHKHTSNCRENQGQWAECCSEVDKNHHSLQMTCILLVAQLGTSSNDRWNNHSWLHTGGTRTPEEGRPLFECNKVLSLGRNQDWRSVLLWWDRSFFAKVATKRRSNRPSILIVTKVQNRIVFKRWLALLQCTSATSVQPIVIAPTITTAPFKLDNKGNASHLQGTVILVDLWATLNSLILIFPTIGNVLMFTVTTPFLPLIKQEHALIPNAVIVTTEAMPKLRECPPVELMQELAESASVLIQAN